MLACSMLATSSGPLGMNSTGRSDVINTRWIDGFTARTVSRHLVETMVLRPSSSPISTSPLKYRCDLMRRSAISSAMNITASSMAVPTMLSIWSSSRGLNVPSSSSGPSSASKPSRIISISSSVASSTSGPYFSRFAMFSHSPKDCRSSNSDQKPIRECQRAPPYRQRETLPPSA